MRRAVRKHLVFSRVRSGVEALRSSPPRVWWTSFVLVTFLTGLWCIADPLYAGPDEPAHVIKAAALDHGQLTGEKLSPRLARKLRNGRQDYLMVRVPAFYGPVSTATCFSYLHDVTAACFKVDGSARNVDGATYVARHPPAYYAAVGIASWFGQTGPSAVYIMRFLSALITGGLIATAITALRRSAAPRLLAVGLAIAITPMVLFMNSVVNPSGLEISASLVVWICGLILVVHAHERVDRLLVTAVGIAGCVLALTRQLGPLWLGLIALTMLGLANRAGLRNLARSKSARLWAALIAASSLAQVAWNVIVKPLDVSRSGKPVVHADAPEIVRTTLGATFFRYREMIGNFGWLDTMSPAVTWALWTVVLAFLFFAALFWVTRRQMAVLLALLLATIVVPVVIESMEYREAPYSWQGRYTLPIALGIPILAAVALASTERGRRLMTGRLVVTIGVLLGVAHFFAFAQNLRRYTVGYDGEIQFWKHAHWSPPLSPLLLVILYAIAVGMFIAWLLVLVPQPTGAPSVQESPPSQGVVRTAPL
jgi:hypothetical protein